MERSATRDPHRGSTQGTHTEGAPQRGPTQGTHTGDPHRGPTQSGGPHRGPTTGGEGHTGDPHRTHTDKTHTHTHTPTENNTPDTHTRHDQHPKPPNEHPSETLHNARVKPRHLPLYISSLFPCCFSPPRSLSLSLSRVLDLYLKQRARPKWVRCCRARRVPAEQNRLRTVYHRIRVNPDYDRRRGSD